MFRVLLLNIILLGFHFININAKNYCAANLCPNGKQHIACENNGNFAARCPTNAHLVSLKSHRTFILNTFNRKRNFIASGRLRRYRPARKMATMSWSKELARLASLNVKQCQMRHDQCRNTRRFSHSGQNLAMITYTGGYKRKSVRALLQNRINAWWIEYKNANRRIISRYPRSYTGPAIGHFTIFVAEKNNHVGCAASRFKNGQKNHFLIACNFATTNFVGKPIYRAGKAGSGCRKGRNSKHKSLCARSEFYNGL